MINLLFKKRPDFNVAKDKHLSHQPSANRKAETLYLNYFLKAQAVELNLNPRLSHLSQ